MTVGHLNTGSADAGDAGDAGDVDDVDVGHADRLDAIRQVRERADRVRARIEAAGGDPTAITILAVTKGFDVDAVVAAAGAGLAAVGENYAQELEAKHQALTTDPDQGIEADDVDWHFIGRLQSNKVNKLVGLVGTWQSVDRPSLIDRLATSAPGARILIQVDPAGDPNKGGCAPDDVDGLVGRARDGGLDVVGLMTVGVADDPDATGAGFLAVRRLADHHGLPECSMGMSHDLEAAVTAGTTMVRVGTALFGARPT